MEQNDVFELEEPRTGLRGSLSSISVKMAERANVTETRFLSLLRYSALAGAAIALVVAGVLLSLGLVRQVGPTEVEPEKVSIAADDVVPLKIAKNETSDPAPPKITVPKAIRDRTAAIYKRDFAGFERPDTKITPEQVVDLVWTEERIAQFNALISAGLVDAEGKQISGREALMTNALETVSKAAKTKDYADQLVAYRDAKKVNVCTNRTRTRSRVVDAWDRYATWCSGWYISPVGCSTTRTISEPYEERVCEMKFPDDLYAPAELFSYSIERYANVAQVGLRSAQIDAEEKTAQNHARKMEGQENIGLSGQLFLGFLAVMFLYLFIAMERHNRNLRALMEKPLD
jgi:hypothetical protein